MSAIAETIHTRALPRPIRTEDEDVVRQTEHEADLTAAIHSLKEEIERLQKLERPKSPSWQAIAAVVGVALVIGAYIVSVSMYNATLAGDIKSQQLEIGYLKAGNADLKARLDDMDRKNTDTAKQTQQLREMYFLQFGKKPSKGD